MLFEVCINLSISICLVMVMLLTDKFYFLKGFGINKDVIDYKILPNQYLILIFL